MCGVIVYIGSPGAAVERNMRARSDQRHWEQCRRAEPEQEQEQELQEHHDPMPIKSYQIKRFIDVAAGAGQSVATVLL